MASTHAQPDPVQAALEDALSRAVGPRTPPRLAEAMRYAVMGAGARLRPRLCFAVARACGDGQAAGVAQVAAAIELLHCASLVHDDLPAFDDADLRRGKPTVHRTHSEALAILVGDALIAHAIALGAAEEIPNEYRTEVVRELAACVGSVRGLVAGQAWESEPGTPLDEYHRLKTGALFESAARLGALLAGSEDPDSWATAGLRVGEAYQIADDIRDAFAEEDGKPLGQDQIHDRPSALRELGPREAMRRLHDCVESARTCIPDADDASYFHAWIDAASARLRLVAPASVANDQRPLSDRPAHTPAAAPLARAVV